MGCWRIEIKGKGLQTEDPTLGRNPSGADAIALRVIGELKAAGHDVEIARFVHWPGHQGKEFAEDLLASGSNGTKVEVASSAAFAACTEDCGA
jgi:hypothetical protein